MQFAGLKEVKVESAICTLRWLCHNDVLGPLNCINDTECLENWARFRRFAMKLFRNCKWISNFSVLCECYWWKLLVRCKTLIYGGQLCNNAVNYPSTPLSWRDLWDRNKGVWCMLICGINTFYHGFLEYIPLGPQAKMPYWLLAKDSHLTALLYTHFYFLLWRSKFRHNQTGSKGIYNVQSQKPFHVQCNSSNASIPNLDFRLGKQTDADFLCIFPFIFLPN
jgi:hypothetical protein